MIAVKYTGRRALSVISAMRCFTRSRVCAAIAEPSMIRAAITNDYTKTPAILPLSGITICAMKIYTKTGDNGTTGLLGSGRISKADPRLGCTGSLDELNAALGLAGSHAVAAHIRDQLHQIQNELFVVGSHLAVPPNTSANLPP